MRKFLKLMAVLIGGLALFLFGARFFVGSTTTGTPKTMIVKSDFQSHRFAIETYKINVGHYPSTEQGLKALVERPTIQPLPDDWVQIWDKVPTDPWRREYQYRLHEEEPEDRFELRSPGLDGIEGTQDDQSSLDP